MSESRSAAGSLGRISYSKLAISLEKAGRYYRSVSSEVEIADTPVLEHKE